MSDTITTQASPMPGDWALHRNNQLDEREVSRVEGGRVWILIGGEEFGPFPASQYTFLRPVAGA